jgi:signal peptidase II
VCTSGHFSYPIEVRHQGFLLGSVVDMFQFNVSWPTAVPLLGGQQIFPAIWNLADACISVGLFWAIIRQKKFFPKKVVAEKQETES